VVLVQIWTKTTTSNLERREWLWWWCYPTSGLEFRGESLGLIRAGYTWQWQYIFTSLPYWRHCSDMLGLIVQGENLDSDLGGWIRWWRCLSVAPAFEESCRPCGVMRWLWSLLQFVDRISNHFRVFSFFSSRPRITLVLYDFACCRRVFVCVCVGVGCVHINYADSRCVPIVLCISWYSFCENKIHSLSKKIWLTT